jgi:hypothetical protein
LEEYYAVDHAKDLANNIDKFKTELSEIGLNPTQIAKIHNFEA